MKQKMKVLGNLAIALGIMGAFAFSASQATAYTGCQNCEYPDTTCMHEQKPLEFCQEFCLDHFCEPGECQIPEDRCICFEKK